MSSRIKEAKTKAWIKDCPDFVSNAIQYEVICGSHAYGCNTESSDEDIYGFCMPSKEIIFPHISGYIRGFGKSPVEFSQFQQHHVFNADKTKEYDFTIFNIVKFFHLTMQCNPNMIDTLFVPKNCIVYSTKIGDLVRENRKLFLSKKVWHTFKGYAYQQMKKLEIKKRKLEFTHGPEMIKIFNYTVKYQTHLIRLMLEVEQILEEGDLDLQRNSDILKSVKSGEWSGQRSIEWFESKEASMESLYNASKLPYAPREGEIRELLMKCLEEYYGSLDKLVVQESNSRIMALEI